MQTKLNPDMSGFTWPELTEQNEELADQAATKALSHDDATVTDVSARIADAATRAAALAFAAGMEAAGARRPVPEPSDIDVILPMTDVRKIEAAYDLSLTESAAKQTAAYKAVEVAAIAYAYVRGTHPRATEITAIWEKYRGRKDAVEAETGMTWEAVVTEYSHYEGIINPLKRCLDHALGDLEETWREVALDVGYAVYQAGRITGYRLGFQLCGRLKHGAIDVGSYKAEDVPVLVGMSMTDDWQTQNLLNTLVEFFGLATEEGDAR